MSDKLAHEYWVAYREEMLEKTGDAPSKEDFMAGWYACIAAIATSVLHE